MPFARGARFCFAKIRQKLKADLCYNVRKAYIASFCPSREALVFASQKSGKNSKRIYAIMYARRTLRVFALRARRSFCFAKIRQKLKADLCYNKPITVCILSVQALVGYVGGQVCAAEGREPCQAGNRAALSGLFRAMQAACPLTYPIFCFV